MTSPVGRGSGGGSNDFGMSNRAIELLLKQKGVPAGEIQKFLVSGQPTVSITRVLSPAQIQQISTKSNPFGYSPDNASQVMRGVAGTPVKAGILRQATPVTQVGGKLASTTGGIPLNQEQGRKLSGQAPAGNSTTNRQNLLNKLSDALNLRNRVVGRYNDAAASRQAAPAVENTSASTSINGNLPDFPTGSGVQDYTAPEISMRDFSGQANQLAEQAYGPLFQAIAQGKTNAQSQYNTSDTVVKGLYDKLVQDTQASGVKQGQQYDQASMEAAARAKALQDRQAQVYGESANTQTALLERLGQQQSAPQVISGGLNEQAFQQSQAAQQGDAQQQYYQAGKQNANDYTTGIANAQNTQGTVAREGLVRDLASVLSQYDQQAASGKTQQATTALDLANQLSSRDLQVQTANASNQMGAAQMNQSAQQQALAAQQAAYQNAYSQQRDQRSDFESDRNYGLQENQFKLEAAAAAAKTQGTSAAMPGYVPLGQDGFEAQSTPQQVIAQADSIDPGRGQEYLGLFDAAVRSFDLATNPSTFDFANRAAELAKQKGLSPAAAFAAAATYWKKVMNRS